MFAWLFCEWTMADTGFLAQASMPRLGETNRVSPKLFYANGRSGDLISFLARCNLAYARRGSLERDIAEPIVPLFEPSPRWEGSRLSEKVSLPWARHVSLSKNEGRFWCYCWMVHWCVACLFDLNALLEGLRDDAMINIWGWDGNGMWLYWVWIGKHELYDWLFIHDISVMGTS